VSKLALRTWGAANQLFELVVDSRPMLFPENSDTLKCKAKWHFALQPSYPFCTILFEKRHTLGFHRTHTKRLRRWLVAYWRDAECWMKKKYKYKLDVVGEFKMVYPERYNQTEVSLTPNYELRVTNYELTDSAPFSVTPSFYGLASNVLILEVNIAINSLHSS